MAHARPRLLRIPALRTAFCFDSLVGCKMCACFFTGSWLPVQTYLNRFADFNILQNQVETMPRAGLKCNVPRSVRRGHHVPLPLTRAFRVRRCCAWRTGRGNVRRDITPALCRMESMLWDACACFWAIRPLAQALPGSCAIACTLVCGAFEHA